MYDKFSVPKTLLNIIIYFVLFLAGDLCSSFIFDMIFRTVELPYRELYVIFRMFGCLLFTYFLFWIYKTKVLHMKMRDFGITFDFKKWGILLAILLPAFVVSAFLIVGRAEIHLLTVTNIILTVISSMLIAVKAGVLEEMLFRGFIMKLLENRWNKLIAIIGYAFVCGIIIWSMSRKTFH